jgi:hypothetical protein
VLILVLFFLNVSSDGSAGHIPFIATLFAYIVQFSFIQLLIFLDIVIASSSPAADDYDCIPCLSTLLPFAHVTDHVT